MRAVLFQEIQEGQYFYMDYQNNGYLFIKRKQDGAEGATVYINGESEGHWRAVDLEKKVDLLTSEEGQPALARRRALCIGYGDDRYDIGGC